MGFDLITWAPRIGSSGDDAYNVPGSTNIDLSVDTDNPTINVPGIFSFSSPPTIPEINAATLWNQAIGALNRRIQIFNSLFGTTLTTLSYLTARVTAANVTAIQSKINAMRAQEGFAAFSFTTATAGNGHLRFGYFLAEIRKSLRISGVATFSADGTVVGGHRAAGMKPFKEYARTDTSYPGTPSTEALNTCDLTGSNSRFAGKIATNVRGRMLLNCPIPDYATAISSATFTFNIQNHVTGDGTTPGVYTSNTDDSTPTLGSGYNGSAYNTNNLEGTTTNTNGSKTVTLTNGHVTALAGARLCFIMVSTEELAGTGSGATTADYNVDSFDVAIDYGA